jgi:hypothetical protein
MNARRRRAAEHARRTAARYNHAAASVPAAPHPQAGQSVWDAWYAVAYAPDLERLRYRALAAAEAAAAVAAPRRPLVGYEEL